MNTPSTATGHLRRLSRRQRQEMYHLAFALDAAKKHTNTRMLTRYEDFMLNRRATRLNAGITIVHACMRDLVSFESENVYRTRDQRIIQMRVMSGCAPIIFGEAVVKANAREIMLMFGWESLDQELLLHLPRRSGKTESIAQVCAVMYKNVPGIDMVMIAPSQRQSGADSGFMGRVIYYLGKLGIIKFTKSNEELLKLTVSDTDSRKFKAYPGGAVHK